MVRSGRLQRTMLALAGTVVCLGSASLKTQAATSISSAAPSPAPSSAPAQAGTPSAPLSYLPSGSRAIAQGQLDRAASVRRQVATGSYMHAVQAVLGEKGAAVAPAPPLPLPSKDDLQRVTALPAPLRAPVAGMYAAVAQASERIGSIEVSEIRAELQQIDDADIALPARRAAAAGPATSPLVNRPLAAQPVPEVNPYKGLALRPRTSAAVQADPQAVLLIAEALDAYVPQIEAAKGSAPDHTGVAVNGCDMLDDTPVLCVGGTGDNTYTQDEMLLIDLGGNNTYDNGAGAAPFALTGAASGQTEPVSVNLDIGGGKDTYNAPLSALGSSTSPLVMGQGAAITGGVGFSVNTSGDDVYNAAVAAPPPPGADGSLHYSDAVAQGAGIVGAGFLFDGGGSDIFSVTLPRLDHAGSFVVDAQGASEGFVGGVGSMVTTGGGDDTYTVSGGGADAPRGAFVFVIANVQGASDGDGTEALLYDDGGSDSFTVSSRSDDALPAVSQLYTSQQYQLWAQGSASLGSAMLLEGTGSHTYRTAIDMEGGADDVNVISSQGSAGLSGYALLQDDGSGNTYDVEAVMHHQQTTIVDDSCGCSSAALHIDAGAGDMPTTLDHTYIYTPEVVQAQGSSTNGVAIVDNAGAATYRTVATATMDVTLHDELSHPTNAASLAVQGWVGPYLFAQGALQLGYPAETPTEALLLNRSGQAAYSVVTGDAVHAAATSLHGPAPIVTARSGFQWQSAEQGAAAWSDVPTNGDTAALLDMGGPNDTFDVVQDTSAMTSPDTGHGLSPGGFWTTAQGAGDPGILVVAGADPTIVTSPANGVCPASPSPRGFGTWVACDFATNSAENADLDHQSYDWLGGFYGPGHAGGSAPNATGGLPLLTLTAPSSGAEGSTVSVSVTLRNAAGNAMTNQPVHISLQGGIPYNEIGTPAPNQGDQWINFGEITLTTGADGTASGALPIDLTDLVGGPPSTDIMDNYRVVATYDGASGVEPHHVASTISLSDGGPNPGVPDLPLPGLTLMLAALGVFVLPLTRLRRHAADRSRSQPSVVATRR